MVTPMLAEAKLPRALWGQALQLAVRINNPAPTSAVQGKSPYEAFYGKKPDLSMLRVFGCLAYVHIQKDFRDDAKWHTQRCIYLGFTEGYKGFKCYNDETGKITISRDVEFDENTFPGVEWTDEDAPFIPISGGGYFPPPQPPASTAQTSGIPPPVTPAPSAPVAPIGAFTGIGATPAIIPLPPSPSPASQQTPLGPSAPSPSVTPMTQLRVPWAAGPALSSTAPTAPAQPDKPSASTSRPAPAIPTVERETPMPQAAPRKGTMGAPQTPQTPLSPSTSSVPFPSSAPAPTPTPGPSTSRPLASFIRDSETEQQETPLPRTRRTSAVGYKGKQREKRSSSPTSPPPAFPPLPSVEFTYKDVPKPKTKINRELQGITGMSYSAAVKSRTSDSGSDSPMRLCSKSSAPSGTTAEENEVDSSLDRESSSEEESGSESSDDSGGGENGSASSSGGDTENHRC